MTGSRENLTFAQRRPKVGAACALLILALLQISIAGHEFAHTVDQLSTTCETCIQQDRIDDFLVSNAEVSELSANDSRPSVALSTSATTRPLFAFTARGPPPA